MEGSATSSSLQVLCSSSSSAGGGGGGTHHHLLQFNHQSRVPRFPGSGPSGVRLTTTSTTTLPGKAGTARCGSKGVSLDSTNDPPHGGGGGGEEEEEEQGRWVEKLMGENIGRDKCKDDEGKGLAALLECLEREAIMGDDNGKQPTDYNRRAQIFDRSSRFFQHHHQPSPP